MLLLTLLIVFLTFFVYQKIKRDQFGKTALMRAAEQNKRADVLLLVKFGANVNAKDKQGRNVLFYSYGFHKGSIDMVQLLIQAGVDVNATDNTGATVLMYACAIGSVEMVKILLQAGADVHRVDKHGLTAFAHIRPQKLPPGIDPNYELPYSSEDMKQIQDLLHQYGVK